MTKRYTDGFKAQVPVQEVGNATLVARRYESSRNIFYPRMRDATCVFSGPLYLDDVWELPAHIADLPSQAARTIGTHYKQPLSVSLAAFLFNRYKEPFRDMRVTMCIGT